MFHKTRGIVLNHMPYNDSAIVAHIYTESFGRQSFFIPGSRSHKSKQRSGYFQPLFLLELEVTHKPQEMQKLKEVRNYPVFRSIPFDIHKTTMAIFISEVLYRTLREEEPNPELFEFIWNSLLLMDLETERISNFHLFFLLKLTPYLGFKPTANFSDKNKFFDMSDGRFVESPPLHQLFLEENISRHLYNLLVIKYDDCIHYPLHAHERVTLLKQIIHYYDIHFEGIRKIQSLNILKEVFHF